MIRLNGPDGKRVLLAMESLRGNRDWEIVVDWFRKSLGQVFVECGTFSQDMARYPFNSGRNYELKDLITTIDKAKETLESMK